MSQYTVYVTPAAGKEIKDLPGNMRQRVRAAIEKLAENARPPTSKNLEVSNITAEARRLRLDRWRIVYAILETEKLIDILAVRKRPPYDYADLLALLADYLPT